MAETVHANGGSKYNATAFNHAWQKSVVDQSEPLQAWGLAQVVEHVAYGLRENTRRHQIFPAKDTDQYRVLSHEEKMAAFNSQLESGNFNARERSIILERVRSNAQNAERQPAEKTSELQR